MSDMIVDLDFVLITQRLKQAPLPNVDWVVGIATGGTVPASLAAFQLDRPLSLISINYRHPDNSPKYEAPQLLQSAIIAPGVEHILLVDDVSVSGQTLSLAKSLLADYKITTLTMKGTADIVLFPEVGSCVNWPWQVDRR